MTAYVSPAAKDDLDDIWRYIARDSFDAAQKVVERIEAAVNRLARFPGLGHSRHDSPDPRFLFLSVYSYVIVYRITRQRLVVVRIVHGARNMRQVLE